MHFEIVHPYHTDILGIKKLAYISTHKKENRKGGGKKKKIKEGGEGVLKGGEGCG